MEQYGPVGVTSQTPISCATSPLCHNSVVKIDLCSRTNNHNKTAQKIIDVKWVFANKPYLQCPIFCIGYSSLRVHCLSTPLYIFATVSDLGRYMISNDDVKCQGR